jgi:hypothetical protein
LGDRRGGRRVVRRVSARSRAARARCCHYSLPRPVSAKASSGRARFSLMASARSKSRESRRVCPAPSPRCPVVGHRVGVVGSSASADGRSLVQGASPVELPCARATPPRFSGGRHPGGRVPAFRGRPRRSKRS